MGLANKQRKLLWGRSGNRCAICKTALVVDSTDADEESIVGEECHIVSKQVNGPRYRPYVLHEDRDSYDNMILLCSVHHKIIDDQTCEYIEDKLRNIKRDHEKWVTESLGDGSIKPLRLKGIKGEQVDYLYRIASGTTLFKIIDQACGAYTAHPDPKDDIEAELIGTFLQSISDWSDISGDLEPYERVKAGFEINQLMQEVEEAGFWVFGNREKKLLEGGVGEPTVWYMAYITIARNDDPMIINIDNL